jgi:hypothetical protein
MPINQAAALGRPTSSLNCKAGLLNCHERRQPLLELDDEYRDSGDSQDRCALKLIMLEHLQGEIGFIKCHWSRMR